VLVHSWNDKCGLAQELTDGMPMQTASDVQVSQSAIWLSTCVDLLP
jgi:hypothetical protein